MDVLTKDILPDGASFGLGDIITVRGTVQYGTDATASEADSPSMCLTTCNAINSGP